MSFDHVAVAVMDEDAVGDFIEARMGGKRVGHNGFFEYEAREINVGSWTFPGEQKLEVIARAPFPRPSFLDAFLAKHKDAAFHHATFIVGKTPEALQRAAKRAKELGCAVTGYNENPYFSGDWGEFFLSPRTTPSNILVQCAFQTELPMEASLEWWDKHRKTKTFGLPERERVQLRGLLLTCAEAESPRRLFVDLLGGTHRVLADGCLAFSFPDSALCVFVRISNEKEPPRLAIDAHSHARLEREHDDGSLLQTFRGLFVPFVSQSAL